MEIVERIKALVSSPKTEWPVIEAEKDDIASVLRNYVAVLAAIPAVCGFIGLGLVGVSVPVLGTVRLSFFAALASAVLGYVLSFVKIYIVGYIIDALAPTFGGQKNLNNALKTAAYSYTPAWLVGVFLLVPALGFLGILALYGLYLVWTGLPVMMKAPQDRALPYTGAVIAIAIVVGIVIAFIESSLIRF